jgi:hypothetical protein
MDLTLKQRLDDTFFQILRLPLDADKVRDLKRVWKNCSEIYQEMSRESINCRRTGRDTPRMQDLKARLSDGIDTLEQYLVFATLLSH